MTCWYRESLSNGRTARCGDHMPHVHNPDGTNRRFDGVCELEGCDHTAVVQRSSFMPGPDGGTQLGKTEGRCYTHGTTPGPVIGGWIESRSIGSGDGLVPHRYCGACGTTLFADEPDHTEETCPAGEG